MFDEAAGAPVAVWGVSVTKAEFVTGLTEHFGPPGMVRGDGVVEAAPIVCIKAPWFRCEVPRVMLSYAGLTPVVFMRVDATVAVPDRNVLEPSQV